MQFQNLSDQQKAGQRLMIGFNGARFNDELKYAIDTLNVGGLILFSRNIISPDQTRELCCTAQSYASQSGQPPLFIAIDQEGGMVARLKPPFTQFTGNPTMRSIEDAVTFAKVTARELGQIGVNMNMAPVLDVAPIQGPSVMSERVFGSDPHWVTRMGLTVIEQLQAGGVMAVGKHFPGIGRTVLDSHDDLPDLAIDLETLAGSDLVPFQGAIDHHVGGLMLSHIRYTGIDPQWPASLSTPIARKLLRGEMGFKGLVLTDDLDMGAIAKHYHIDEIVMRCLAAEVDILLICHAGPNIEIAFNEILRHCQANENLRRKNETSIQRILSAKAECL